MSEPPVRISRKEFTSQEVLDRIESGQRIIVTIDVFGSSKEITLRKTDDKYLCDTGLKLMSYEDRDGLKTCIERLRLVEDD